MNSIGSDPMNLQGEQPQSKEPFPLEQLVTDLFTHKITPFLNAKDLAALSQQSRKMHLVAKPALEREWIAIKASITVGPEEWRRVGFEVFKAPYLPKDIDQILKSKCPYFEKKRVFETHKLMYIPPGLSINKLGHLMRHLREGEGDTVFDELSWSRIFQEIGNEEVTEGYWALVIKDLIPDSRNIRFDVRQFYLKEGYEDLSVIDAVALATMHCEFSGGERLFSEQVSDQTYACRELTIDGGERLFYVRDSNKTYTYCKQTIDEAPLVVGNFTLSGLVLEARNMSCSWVGICAMRKLPPQTNLSWHFYSRWSQVGHQIFVRSLDWYLSFTGVASSKQ